MSLKVIWETKWYIRIILATKGLSHFRKVVFGIFAFLDVLCSPTGIIQLLIAYHVLQILDLLRCNDARMVSSEAFLRF